MGRWDEPARLKFIAENSWEQRFERLLDVALPDAFSSQPSISSRG
jgi:hypothetical protein